MLRLYRSEDCRRCEGIEQTLNELCMGAHVVVVGKGCELPSDLPVWAKLPVLVDDNEVIQGSRNIVKHLEKLEKFRKLWYKYQSDACYCGEHGDID